ncbi:MAG: hypothetical protein ACI3Y9_06725, partial [Candidatus Cryptobacteroides sp.]
KGQIQMGAGVTRARVFQGIILSSIPPETATFSKLYALEQEIQNKLCSYKLAKALKVCMMPPAGY